MKQFQKTMLGMVFASVAIFPATADVKVTFSNYLNKKMDVINRIEVSRESKFRENQVEGPNGNTVGVTTTFYKNRFRHVKWGNEKLIPNMADYTVENLITAMMEQGMREAAPDFDGEVKLHIERLNVNNFAAGAIRSKNVPTRMRGWVSVYDAAGNLVKEEKVSSIAYNVNVTFVRDYDGRGYMYQSSAADTRVGPVAAEFTEKALKKIFPEYNAQGAVLVR